MRPRILITGAGGFLGSRLVSAFCGPDCDLVATLRRLPPAELPRMPGCHYVSCDISDAAAVAALFRDHGPFDIVLNAAAAMPGSNAALQSLYVHTNVAGQAHLVDAAASSGCRRFVFCSSISVYDGAGHFDEGRPLTPGSPYGLSKYIAEQVLQLRLSDPRTDMTGVSLRFAGIHGPGRKGGIVATVVSAARNNADITIDDPESYYRLCFAADAIEAIRACIAMPQPPKCRSYNVAGLEIYTLRELAERVVALSGSTSRIVTRCTPARLDKVLDISALQRDCAYAPSHLDVHLASMLA